MNIKGKIAYVTGGASGMGHATAVYLADQGVKVMMVDVSDAVHANAKTIGAESYIVDVTSETDINASLDALETAFGAPPHIVVNCAGICPGARVIGRDAPHDLDLFDKTIRINLLGSFNVLRLCANRMVNAEPLNDDNERGVVINTASVAAYEGQIGQAAYSASKGGVVGMTLPIARELAKFGIRVATIAPGIMETPMISAMPDHVQESLKATSIFPKRLGTAQEFAKLVAHICENTMINGETIRLDGALRLAPK